MEDRTAEDRRATRRFALQLPVTLTENSGVAMRAMAQMRDVSSHGICFDCDIPLELSTSIEFIVTLPAEITMTEAIAVRCRGMVVRAERGQEGKFKVAAAIDHYEFLAEGSRTLVAAGDASPAV
jgi:hypothetical protein